MERNWTAAVDRSKIGPEIVSRALMKRSDTPEKPVIVC